MSVFIMRFYYKQNYFLELLKDLALNKAEPQFLPGGSMLQHRLNQKAKFADRQPDF